MMRTFMTFTRAPAIGTATLRIEDRHHAAREVQLAAGSTGSTIVLDEGASLRGRVLAPDGSPIAKAWVQLCGSSGSCDAVDTTNATFVFAHLVPGSYKLGVRVQDHPLLASRYERRDISLQNETRVEDFLFTGGLELAGTAKPRTCVHAYPKDAFRVVSTLTSGEVFTKSDANGHFEFHRIHVGTWLVGQCDGQVIEADAGRIDVDVPR
jgi:hypothetical protein